MNIPSSSEAKWIMKARNVNSLEEFLDDTFVYFFFMDRKNSTDFS